MGTKSIDWRPGPTVCRCCLAEGCYKDISTEYFWMGKREVYSEMLTETFDINIAYSTSGPNSNSRLICEPCISRLRDAAEFKRQVHECEKTFMQYLDPGASSTMLDTQVTVEVMDSEVKLEQVKQEKAHSDEDDDDDFAGPNYPDDDDDDDDLDDQPLTKFATRVPKKESVDILDLLDNAKAAEKRKSTTKSKAPPPKKIKVNLKDIQIKPTASKTKSSSTQGKVLKITPTKPIQVKPVTKVVKKKKGEPAENTTNLNLEGQQTVKKGYQRSARAESRFVTKKNANSILECFTFCPFRWKKNRFTCGYCEEEFTDCSLLRNHVALCSNGHSVRDIYKKFKEMSLINIDVTDSVCRRCLKPFVNMAQVREHVINHGLDFNVDYPDGVLPFSLNKESWRCIICQEMFNNFLKLYEHMNTHYQHYICAICGKGYMTAPRLRKHSEVHLSGSFPCNECGKDFNMRAARDYHKANAHAKGPRYECPQCNIRFNNYYERMNHLNEAHREKEVLYQCTHCTLSFKTSGKRAMHLKTVHFPPKRDFGCQFCDWKFRTAYELRRHMVKHTGHKDFHCDTCGKEFHRHRALRIHLKTHDSLSCKWCGVAFKQAGHLFSHMKTNHPNYNLPSASNQN